VDPVPKQARASNLEQVRLEIEIAAAGKPRAKCFGNSPEGWRQLMAWLKEQKIKRVHACLEATGSPAERQPIPVIQL
jgi:hypothetical protein